MVELIKDETNIEVKNDKAIVTRVMVEEFEAGEYLKACKDMQQKIDVRESDIKDLTAHIANFASHKEVLQKVYDRQQEVAKKEREEFLAKQKAKAEEVKNETSN